MNKEKLKENCCTPEGQIKRYIDCKGCDRKPKQETLEERIQYIAFLHKQNLNGRETEDELFEAGILAGIEETLEDAAEKRIPTSTKVWNLTETRRSDFKAGAKWQAERMYSEEDLEKAFKHGILFKEESVSTCEEAIETEFSMLVEQLKKK